MAVSWETLKSRMRVIPNTSAFYTDDEGSKIPIDSDREFQEAMRLARSNNTALKLTFCGDKGLTTEIYYLPGSEPTQCFLNPGGRLVDVKPVNANAMSSNAMSSNTMTSGKENLCNCRGDEPPEWFTRYMKKFKKEIIHEMKTYVQETVHSAIDKKLSNPRSDEWFTERNDNLFSPIISHTKKKKRSFDVVDYLLEPRPLRLPKKLNATRPERLEILDQKTKALLEEKRRLLENRYHSKSRLDRNYFCRNLLQTRSASFLQTDMHCTVHPDEDFCVPVNINNDGATQWRSPQFVCFETKGVLLRSYTHHLPNLCPRGRCTVNVTGRVKVQDGPHYFKCRVIDPGSEVEHISPVFTCRFDVIRKVPAAGTAKGEDKVGTLIDFEKDLISSSQKKIEENINEIERRLQDIELLQPSTNLDAVEKAAEEAFPTDCDLIQLENRLESEDVRNKFGYAGTTGLLFTPKVVQQGTVKDGPFYKQPRDMDLDSSDSEVSIVFVLDEEEEEDDEDKFFMVNSSNLTASESANDDKKPGNAETNGSLPAEEPGQQSAKPDTKPETPRRDETSAKDTSQGSPTRCRCSPLAEEISKPKKMKSKSTEYCFTTANLTQPTFTQIPGFSAGRPSRFTFTGEKEDKGKTFKKDVPDTDALGRTIYAVNSIGRCYAVKGLFEEEGETRPGQFEGRQGGQNRQERRSGEPGSQWRPKRDRLPDNQPLNTLPNALLNGASNVASLAYSTAKSVISNLQSAFVTEGKTEMGTPAFEDKVRPSMEAMLKLVEMGYLDIEKNRMLLFMHHNNMTKVIDELVRLNENPTERIKTSSDVVFNPLTVGNATGAYRKTFPRC